jgi:hypothetical protein
MPLSKSALTDTESVATTAPAGAYPERLDELTQDTVAWYEG